MAKRRGQNRQNRMHRPDLIPAVQRRMRRRCDRRSRRGPQIIERKPTAKELHGRPRRTDAQVRFPGVARFSKDAENLSQVEIVKLAKQYALLTDLRLRPDYNFGGGRPRVKGKWILASGLRSGRPALLNDDPLAPRCRPALGAFPSPTASRWVAGRRPLESADLEATKGMTPARSCRTSSPPEAMSPLRSLSATRNKAPQCG